MRLLIAGVVAISATWMEVAQSEPVERHYQAAKWHPIHFKPTIDEATNEQCLACHGETLERRVRDASPAGVRAADSLAWYQTLSTYEGEQDSFHRRHLVGPMAQELMDLKCNTCHQGNDPREETANSFATGDSRLTQRKHVDPNICLMCHGTFRWEIMTGLTGPWTESGELFANNCLACHAAFRTVRHQVNFLKPEAIEKAGARNGDICYGCHGGRSWYRISYPYPRHEWPGMAPQTPDWAKDRPTASEPRFLIGVEGMSAKAQ
jgi:hypothetical protein